MNNLYFITEDVMQLQVTQQLLQGFQLTARFFSGFSSVRGVIISAVSKDASPGKTADFAYDSFLLLI